jgi:hypothetical protein
MGKSWAKTPGWSTTHLLACDECCLRLVQEAELLAVLCQALRDFKTDLSISSGIIPENFLVRQVLVLA